MGNEPEAARRPMSAWELSQVIATFIDSHYHAYDVKDRWLADWLKSPLQTIRQVASGNLDPSLREAVDNFRLGEIEKTKAERQKAIDELDREAKQIRYRAES